MNQGSNGIVLVFWRGRQIKVEINSDSNVKELGLKLLELTKVKADTMKLLIPPSNQNGSKLLIPFSVEHSDLSLQEAAILVGKPIRMMGVFEDEVEEVSHNSLKPDLRIIGFDEEEKRMKQRLLNWPTASIKLPQGTYIFCDFKTLHISGIELNPPPSEALKRMHMLACDPGIIAIMNKHRWRVGIMTEMVPVGYVGISPKCLLGFNKNHGEEISLRLRTDDLKGFRKYESIKKTLLHELAHMVYSEHDADFFALNKQLNEEVESLDWTKSRSRTLNGKKLSKPNEEAFCVDTTSNPAGQKVGGRIISASARAASVAAAYDRIMNSSISSQNEIEMKTKDGVHVPGKQKGIAIIESELEGGTVTVEDIKDSEPDPDDGLSIQKHDMQIDCLNPHSDDSFDAERVLESDPDKFLITGIKQYDETDPDDPALNKVNLNSANEFEPDPDDSRCVDSATEMKQIYPREPHSERDPDNCKHLGILLNSRGYMESVPEELQKTESGKSEPDPDDSMEEYENQELQRIEEPLAEPDPDDSMEESHNQEQQRIKVSVVEPDLDDSMEAPENEELQRIKESVAATSRRLLKAIEEIRSEATPVEAVSSLQTLFKIIRNVIEHPNDAKFRRIRKANPSFQKNVANYKAAMDILAIVGFSEDVTNEIGRLEAYLVLKRNDPGLLWLAKSSLEVSIA